MDVLTLLPFAGCELERRPGRWLDQVLAGQIPSLPERNPTRHTGAALVERVLRGGYPP